MIKAGYGGIEGDGAGKGRIIKGFRGYRAGQEREELSKILRIIKQLQQRQTERKDMLAVEFDTRAKTDGRCRVSGVSRHFFIWVEPRSAPRKPQQQTLEGGPAAHDQIIARRTDKRKRPSVRTRALQRETFAQKRYFFGFTARITATEGVHGRYNGVRAGRDEAAIRAQNR